MVSSIQARGWIQDLLDIRQTLVNISVHTLHILEHDLLPQNHLVERANEKCVKESSVEYSQAHHPTNEFEVVEMFWVDARMRVDLKRVVVVGRIFKQAVKRIEHFMREQEEKFPASFCVSRLLCRNNQTKLTWRLRRNLILLRRRT